MLLMTSSSRELKLDPLKLSILETGDLCQRSRQAAKPLPSCKLHIHSVANGAGREISLQIQTYGVDGADYGFSQLLFGPEPDTSPAKIFLYSSRPPQAGKTGLLSISPPNFPTNQYPPLFTWHTPAAGSYFHQPRYGYPYRLAHILTGNPCGGLHPPEAC
ncbi:uncharacterized protein CCOS01_01695 [Colletotrichum costaricense]|uniref:Uncharacterized protein n=1 Tax=Colletotrichum costaricense TaxID=1209916 RepID=A0AAI9Z616_9PEZI|nr:uncharacterized protein CCOS01_01695 [Colletotrichum costaricense]KAK1536375.1 hypothetical protein CCOS01_01695 [Colletotrichum costaricense]